MDALGWGWNWAPKSFHSQHRHNSKPSDSVDATGRTGSSFPLKQAITAGSLALTGDTIAQLNERWRKGKASKKLQDDSHSDAAAEGFNKDVMTYITEHDWIRAMRMTSYGFLFYGPGSYAWYQYLDRCLPTPTAGNIMLKVLLNQIVLGPCVIAVVFAWNNLLQGKLSQLPNKYQNDALPALLYGFRFWIPVSALNFWVVPLHGRVAFMSMGSIFWNFYLSSTMSK